MDFSVEPARPNELAQVLDVVEGCGLPIAGITDAYPTGYVVIREPATILAVAGLETHGNYGLLRSLAVAKTHRGLGLGKRLVTDRLREAKSLHLEAVYLRTTTAAEYFRSLGFTDASRSAAPELLLKSGEFLSVCPASAVCLAVKLS